MCAALHNAGSSAIVVIFYQSCPAHKQISDLDDNNIFTQSVALDRSEATNLSTLPAVESASASPLMRMHLSSTCSGLTTEVLGCCRFNFGLKSSSQPFSISECSLFTNSSLDHFSSTGFGLIWWCDPSQSFTSILRKRFAFGCTELYFFGWKSFAKWKNACHV